MRIELDNIEPLSFDMERKADSIWGNPVVLSDPKTVQVIASSGTGKSTLIGILSGLRSDYSGTVRYDGSDIRSHSAAQWSMIRSRKISLVYQDLRLFPHLTGRENLLLSQVVSGRSNGETMPLIEEFAGRLGIRSQTDKPVSQMSFGQMQRIAIIRSVIRNYEWLLLDEPFSHLDRDNAAIAWELILGQAAIRKAGIIIACLDPYDFIQADTVYHL